MEGPADFRYRWTYPEFSILLPAGTTGIKFHGMVPQYPAVENGKSIKLIMGDEEVGKEVFSSRYGNWDTFQINLVQPIVKDTYGIFKLNYYYCPQDYGQSQDSRKLGITVSKIDFIKNNGL